MRWITTLVLATALLSVVGCASSGTARLSHDEYLAALRQIEMSPAVQDADRRFFELASGMSAGSGVIESLGETQCRDGAKRFSDDVRSIVDAVARLSPPADAADLQRRFVAAAGRTADELEKLAEAVADGRISCGQPWNRRAYGLASTAEAERVLAEYAERGYLIDANSGD